MGELDIITNSENVIYKIYDYTKNIEPINFSLPPYDLNYNVVGLHKRRFFNKGELIKVEYYGSATYDTGIEDYIYDDLVLVEERNFLRRDHLVKKRIQTTTWYLSSGDIGCTKTTNKYYSLEDSIKLGERRRRNVVSKLKMDVVGLIQMAEQCTVIEANFKGLSFLDEIIVDISKFIDGIESPILDQFLYNTNHTWLDFVIPNTNGLTVRMYLYNETVYDFPEDYTN